MDFWIITWSKFRLISYFVIVITILWERLSGKWQTQFPQIRLELQEMVTWIVQQEDIFTTWYLTKVNDLKTSTTAVSCVGMWRWQSWALIWWTENPSGGLSGDFLFPVEHFCLVWSRPGHVQFAAVKNVEVKYILLFNTAVISSCLQMSEALSHGLHRAQRNVRPACWPQASLYYIWLSGWGVAYMVCGGYDACESSLVSGTCFTH